MGEYQDKEYYNEVFKVADQYHCEPEKSHYYKLWLTIVDILDNKENIAEICCGTGQLAKILLKNGFNYIWGSDFSDVAINMCKCISQNFFIQDIEKETINTEGINTIICTEGIEHLKDDIKFINSLPTGIRFIFSVPTYDDKAHVIYFENIMDAVNRYQCLEFKKAYICSTNNSDIYIYDTIKK